MAAPSEEGGHVLQFLPFSSSLDPGFWHELGKRKLEQYQLREDPVPIRGLYGNYRMIDTPFLSLDYAAFETGLETSGLDFTSPGLLRNTNTMNSFNTLDKKALLDSRGRDIWESIKSGAALTDPSLLMSFVLLTHADLKKYHFSYWFGFPALSPSVPVNYTSINRLENVFGQDDISHLTKAYDEFQKANKNVGFFLVAREGQRLTPKPLTAFDEVFKSGSGEKNRLTVGFCDPSTLDSNPGWPLRNFLYLISQNWGQDIKEVDVLCYRDVTRDGKRQIGHSLFVEGAVLPDRHGDDDPAPKVTGWERNKNNKLAPRFVNLSSNMDPAKLAESAVDLNLKLMRWRVMPSLDLSLLQNSKCLLLGSGTLGCNVSRCLLGWGVRKITLVDNSKVSYSNPVRQSLFKFEDCLDGGVKKADAAAKSLKVIYPGVDAEGIELGIPMPGHAIGSEEKAVDEVRTAVKRLEELIKSHDIVFLLMDTRESRWLPTLLTSAFSKLCINAALGFDTFMVMRHGYRPPNGGQKQTRPLFNHIPGSELGCYFCNDVVAPTDSTRDRTLDQQCTVSRPGLSMIASGLAVELLSSLLQHHEKGLAPADSNPDQDEINDMGEADGSVLGLVPHQIRGFLSRFQNVIPASQRFDKCTACSDIVLNEYAKDGFEFLLKVFNTPNYLEDLTGLSKLYAETLDDHVWELSDDDDD